MAKIERSPAEESHFLYVSDSHIDGYIPIHSKRDLLMLIKLASESLQMLEEERHDMQDEQDYNRYA
jgi:hypothetical protein